jgi:4a-hydroxytetrahydrobiopterin dehydratase
MTIPLTTIALSATQIIAKIAILDGWKLWGDGDSLCIEKTFTFSSYLETMAFANAIAFLAQREDHHPQMVLQQTNCSVRFRTDSVNGISPRDFTCAALVDALLAGS